MQEQDCGEDRSSVPAELRTKDAVNLEQGDRSVIRGVQKMRLLALLRRSPSSPLGGHCQPRCWERTHSHGMPRACTLRSWRIERWQVFYLLGGQN